PNEIILVVSPMDGRVIDCNKTACRALGFTKHELLHRGVQDLVPSPSRSEDMALLRGVLEGIMNGTVTDWDAAFITKSGRVFPTHNHALPIEVDGQRWI